MARKVVIIGEVVTGADDESVDGVVLTGVYHVAVFGPSGWVVSDTTLSEGASQSILGVLLSDGVVFQ